MSRLALAALLVKRAQENEYSRVALETPDPKFGKAGPKGGGWESPQQQIDQADAYLRQRGGGGASGIAGGLFSSLLGKLKAPPAVSTQPSAAIPMQPTAQPDAFDMAAKMRPEAAPFVPPANAANPYAPESTQLANDIAKDAAGTKPVYPTYR